MDSTSTRLKGMSEFLEAERAVGRAEVAYVPGHGGEMTEEHPVSRSCQTVAKSARRSSIEASSSHKMAHRGSEGAAPSKGTSGSDMKSEPAHVYSNEDEDSNVQLHPRSCRIRGLVVTNVEEGQVTGVEPTPVPLTVKTALSTSL